VGSAEGTRTPNGAFNPAYRGHTDPGNQVWNMGTFSYQHGAKTPEEADQKQLARLKNQGDVLRRRALKHDLNLTLEETLNGLDLANQSPLASIGRVGYIERLVEAKNNGYEGYEAILVARTRSYINPRTGRWNAPGLGNTEPKIRRDQKRRADAIAKAIAAYEAKDPDLQPQTWTLVPPKPDPASLIALAETPEQPVEEIFKVWTSPSDPVATVEPGASELAATTASEDSVALAASDDPLAALWQITTNTVTQLRSHAELRSEEPKEPQAAALFGGWLNGEQASADPSPEPEARQPAAEEPTEEPQIAAFFGGWLNGEEGLDETSTQSAEEASPSSPVAEAAPEQQSGENSDGAAQEPAMMADSPEASTPLSPDGPTPPTWAATREANQAVSLEVTAAETPEPLFPGIVPGAVPDSAVYAPMAVVEPWVVDETAASAAEPSAEAPIPSDIKSADQQIEAEALEFEPVDVDAMEQPEALDGTEPSETVDYKRSSAEGAAL
jgi:hypothetical protein